MLMHNILATKLTLATGRGRSIFVHMLCIKPMFIAFCGACMGGSSAVWRFLESLLLTFRVRARKWCLTGAIWRLILAVKVRNLRGFRGKMLPLGYKYES